MVLLFHKRPTGSLLALKHRNENKFRVFSRTAFALCSCNFFLSKWTHSRSRHNYNLCSHWNFQQEFFPIQIMLICTDINNSGGINYPSYFAQKQTTVLSRTYLLGYNALTRCCKDQISHLCKPSSQTTTDLYLGR